MKEDMLEVLLYLFENYMADGSEFQPDQELLTAELTQAGFAHGEIDKAFSWLEDLLLMCEQMPDPATPPRNQVAVRHFTPQERDRLGLDGCGLLLRLESAGVLDSHAREMVIDRAMALETEDMDLENLKWVIMMVLCNHPVRSELAIWAEELVSEDLEALIH